MRFSAIGRIRTYAAVLAFVALTLPVSLQAKEQTLKGVALVIGQSKYEHIPALENPASDARAIVGLLTELGFDARLASDRDAKKLKRDLERFIEDAEGADVAFLYYAGHGIESGGQNWLVPIDADVSSLDNAGETLVALSSVLDELKRVVPVTILLLDACRTNPFPEGALVKKSPDDPGAPIGAGGLVAVRGATSLAGDTTAADALGSVIGFAAEPGRPALDGLGGENSPYTAALLRHLGAMEGYEFGMVMRMVTEEVYLHTRTQQRPWVNESLMRLLYFGVAQDEPSGEDALITGERRQLLLTISELPDFNRAQVETVAAEDGVPLDALYGVLRALGTEKIPQDPAELEKLLDAQAERLKAMIAEREALRTDDPEIERLVRAADRAISEGAIVTARQFLDEAVKRVEATSADVDAAEDAVKRKRLADAAIYALRAKASALVFDYLAAAADYRKAFERIQRWDDKLRLEYRRSEGEALRAHGQATADNAVLEQALAVYREALDFSGAQSLDWALTRNDMALVLQELGELSADTAALEQAAEMFRDSLRVFEREKDDLYSAIAQNNLGTVLLRLGEQEGDAGKLREALAAFRAALASQDPGKVPLNWTTTQSNIAFALFKLAEHETDPEKLLLEAKAAYHLALEVGTRERDPVLWASIQNNLGLTLAALAAAENDVELFSRAVSAYRAALEVRTREHLPMQWAATQLNLAASLDHIGRIVTGTEGLDEAEKALRDVLTVYTRERSPLDWASAQNNLGSVLLLVGQRTHDAVKVDEAAAAFRAALEEHEESRVPLDYAAASYNLGNALQLAAVLKHQAASSGSAAEGYALSAQAIAAYKQALKHYSREVNPRMWALVQANLGATLQWMGTQALLIKSRSAEELLMASIEARRTALEVLARDEAPDEWARAKNGLGEALVAISNLGYRADLLIEAIDSFAGSQQIYTREAQPAQWAIAENNIGDVHQLLAAHGGGRPDYEKAIERFESAKETLAEAGFLQFVPLLDQKIAFVREQMAKL